MRLHRAILFVKDMERMTAFYVSGVGLNPIEETAQDGWVELESNGAILALHAIPEARARSITISDPPKARENTPIKLCFQTSDIEATRAHLTASGATMFEPRSYGCDGLDPEGNVFQLIEG